MLTNFIFLAVGVFATTLVFIFVSRESAVGELQVDTEKEILQMVFYSKIDLAKTIGTKKKVKFNIVHRTLDWDIPQEKQGL